MGIYFSSKIILKLSILKTHICTSTHIHTHLANFMPLHTYDNICKANLSGKCNLNIGYLPKVWLTYLKTRSVDISSTANMANIPKHLLDLGYLSMQHVFFSDAIMKTFCFIVHAIFFIETILQRMEKNGELNNMSPLIYSLNKYAWITGHTK